MSKQFIAAKLAEELTELASVCIQYYLFNRKSEARVMAEIGDVLAWISILRMEFQDDQVDKAMLEKLKVIKGFKSGKIPITFNDPQ